MEITFNQRKAYKSGPSTVLSIPIAVLDSIIAEYAPVTYEAKKEMQNILSGLDYPISKKDISNHEISKLLQDDKVFYTKNTLIQTFTDMLYRPVLDKLRFDLKFNGKELIYRMTHVNNDLVANVEDTQQS